MAQTKAKLEAKINELEKRLVDKDMQIVDKDMQISKLENRVKELEAEKKVRRDDADYISWLHLNYEHLSRFIRENVDVCTEVDYDYYGNASDPYSSLEIRKPSELK